MSLPDLYNIPHSQSELNIWSFANMNEHAKTAAALLRASPPVVLPLYPLDPIPFGAGLGAWLYNHQTIHNAQNAALGIAGNDLTTLDFNDAGQVVNWIQLHASEHYQAAQILELN